MSAKTATKSATKTTQPKSFTYIVFLLIWTAFSIFASQLLFVIIMMALLGQHFESPFWTCVYYILSYATSLALILFVPKKIWQLYQKKHPKTSPEAANNPFTTNSEELGLKTLPTFTDIGLAPVGYAVYIIGASILSTLMQLLPWFNADQTQETGFSYFITGFDRFWAILAIVFIAPIAEEIIMRGWLYGKLRDKLKVPLAIVLTSLVFAVLHGQWNVGVSVFMLSVVLCGLREITGTIWSGIILHILSNGIAFYLLYIAF